MGNTDNKKTEYVQVKVDTRGLSPEQLKQLDEIGREVGAESVPDYPQAIPLSIYSHPEVFEGKVKRKQISILDIIEGLVVLFVSFSLIRNAFHQAGFWPCLIFSAAVMGVFLLMYHEKYIGVVLNAMMCLLWTTLFTLILSFFDIYQGRTVLLVLTGIVILFLSLCIHGLNPIRLIKSLIIRIKSVKVSDKVFEESVEVPQEPADTDSFSS